MGTITFVRASASTTFTLGRSVPFDRHQMVGERAWVKRLIDAVTSADLATLDTLLAQHAQEPDRFDLNQGWRDHGNDPMSVPTAYSPLLHLAVAHGHESVVQRLLRVPGIDANTPDSWGTTVLGHALRVDHPDVVPIVALLLDAGASTQVKARVEHPQNRAPLALWVLKSLTVHTPSLVEQLEDRGLVNLAALDAAGDGLLHRVLSDLPKTNPRPDAVLANVRWLRARGVAIDRVDGLGRRLVDVARPVAPPEVVAEIERWALEAWTPAIVPQSQGPSTTVGRRRTRL